MSMPRANTATAYGPSAAERLTHKLGGTWNGVQGKALCPYHDDHDPSLDIKAGDIRDIIAYCQVCGEVFERRVADGKVDRPSSPTKPQKPSLAKAEPAYEAYLRLRDALKILRASVESGEQPSTYLAARGIDYCPPQAGVVPIPKAKQLLSGRSDREGKRVLPKNAPVMAFPIISKNGLQGAHTTVLNLQGTAKLNDNARRVHGIKKVGYVPLWKDELDPDAPLLVGEGIETTLSAMVLSDYQGVSAIDAGNGASVWLPPCGEIIILKDRDKAGCEFVEGLIARYGASKTIRVAMPPKGNKDWNDALQSDCDREVLKRRIIKAPKVETAEFTGVVTMVELMTMDIPPMTHCLKPILLKTGRTMLSARAGHLKTRLSLSIAYAKATGTPLMDWTADEAGRVLYVDAELSAENIMAWWQRLGPPSPNLYLLSDKLNFRYGLPRITLSIEDGRQYLAERVMQVDPELIILDSLFTLAPPDMGADRVGESTWPAVRQWIDDQVLAGRHVLFLHHDSKGGQQYGSVLKETELDCWLQLKKQPKLDVPGRFAAELSFSKPRHLSVEEQMARIISINTEGVIAWQREDASVGDDHAQRDEQIRQAYAHGKPINQLAAEFRLSYERIRQIVKEAE